MIPNKKISDREGLIVIVCAVIIAILIKIEFYCPCITERYALIFSIATGLLTGIISAIALLYFQERQYEAKINLYYSEIAGNYKRIDIGQDNISDKDMYGMKENNLNLDIVLTHVQGTHSLKLIADYWKQEDAKVEGTIEFNEKNGTTASGRYRYTAGASFIKDSGMYKIYRLEEDKTKLLVLFHKLFPRQLEDHTDKNKGWEIWQKQ